MAAAVRRRIAARPTRSFKGFMTLLRLELVTEALHGDKKLGLSGIVLELLAKAGDMHIDRPREGRRAVTPNARQQVFA
jgi:hypothetical protein